MRTTAAIPPAPDASLDELRASWLRSLRAAGKAPRTIEPYLYALDQFTAWCRDHGPPGRPAGAVPRRRRGLHGLAARRAVLRHRRHPLPVAAPVVQVAGPRGRGRRRDGRDVTPEARRGAAADHPRRRPAGAAGGRARAAGSIERRDTAILRVLIDTGLRVGELCALTLGDVSLDEQLVVVGRSKTRKGRIVPLGTKSVEALDRYLRVRASGWRPTAAAAAADDTTRLWVGLHGHLTTEGVRQMLNKRCREAGVGHVHPHQFRHTAAHRWLLAGGQEQDLARIAGWTPGSAMLGRYGASRRVSGPGRPTSVSRRATACEHPERRKCKGCGRWLFEVDAEGECSGSAASPPSTGWTTCSVTRLRLQEARLSTGAGRWL